MTFFKKYYGLLAIQLSHSRNLTQVFGSTGEIGKGSLIKNECSEEDIISLLIVTKKH
jgi:hypothetical protein